MEHQTAIKLFELDNHIRLDLESLEKYRCSVNQFFDYTKKYVEDIVKSDIRIWLGYLKEKGYKPWTIHSKLTGLKTFFKYCFEEGIILENPAAKIPFPQVEEKLPYYLSLKQLNQFRQFLEEKRLEERAIVEVLYATGIRVSEMCAMKKEDIDWSERTIHIPKGKRKKGRIVLFTLQCSDHLKKYLESRTDNLPYVFLTLKYKNGPIHPDTVGNLFRAYSNFLDFRVTPHTLRHTFAAHFAQKGMPIKCIQMLLGHEEPQQTHYYAKLYNHARKEKYDKFM